MTLKELYAGIGGDYDQAMRTLRIEKLMDKHIRKLPESGIFAELAAAAERMDGTALFESAHAIKGVCANLGLTEIAGLASDIAEEFRPENERKLSDADVRQKAAELSALFRKAVDGIRQYEQAD